MKIKLKLAAFFSLFFGCLNAQTEDLKFSRQVQTPSETWHKIELPDDALQHFNADFSDVRILGKRENASDIEVPYVLVQPQNKITSVEMPFQVINTSRQGAAYFYTFELAKKQKINQILLDFEQQNFDWKIGLEGSENGSDWFLILEDYRILSLKNKQTDYHFTQLDFPDANYMFYRLKVNSDQQPKLNKASIYDHKKNQGNFKISKIASIQKSIDKKQRTTIITVTLEHAVPVENLKIKVGNTFDFYRPITIKALQDSVLTDKGWRLNYKEIYRGTLSSLAQTEFQLDHATTQKLQIAIQNQDNQPLDIQEVDVKHAVFALCARFTEKADFYLYYGNDKAQKPSYDIANFTKNIPENPSPLSLSEETINLDFTSETTTPIFENKLWLWILMGIVILVLGYFSLKMLKE